MTPLDSWLVLQALNLISERLDAIEKTLTSIVRRTKAMSVSLDALKVQVQANTDLEASAITLIQGLADQIAAVATDPAAVAALADQLRVSAASLSDAIVANTPSA